MKIALIGYGKMGKMVEKMALARKHEIVAVIDSNQKAFDLGNAEVCIDFTNPHSVLANIKRSAAQGKNLIIGTTGWHADLPKVESIVKTNNIGLLYSGNFSIGVQIFRKILAEAAKWAKLYPQYDIAGIEEHHNQKLDAPSGTALDLTKIIKDNAGKEITFTSLRCGSIPGTHTIIFDSPIDTITLTHQARNREGFAEGSIMAAEWINNKKGIFTIEEMFQ